MLVSVQDPYWIQIQQKPRYVYGFNKIPGSGFSESGYETLPQGMRAALMTIFVQRAFRTTLRYINGFSKIPGSGLSESGSETLPQGPRASLMTIFVQWAYRMNLRFINLCPT